MANVYSDQRETGNAVFDSQLFSGSSSGTGVFVKVGGVYVFSTAVYAKVGGAYKLADEIHMKQAGVYAPL
ncbi:MAG: hypothetical protein ACEQSK_10990 [Sphingomonadaceae bacterium]|jgi:hypothetical protein